MMKSQRGFIGLGLLLAIILGLAVVGGGAYYVGRQSTLAQPQPASSEATKEQEGQEAAHAQVGADTAAQTGVKQQGQSAVAATTPDASGKFALFAGDWVHHGIAFTIQANGQGTAHWRTGPICGQDVPKPCDTIEGNQIQYGGRATFQLTSAAGQQANGNVITSNEASVVPLGALHITLMPYGMAEWRDSGGATTTICLSNYSNPDFSIEQLIQIQAACGA